VIAVLGLVSWATRDMWRPWVWPPSVNGEETAVPEDPSAAQRVIPTPQARQNLGLDSLPLKLETYWKKIDLPGVIVDRPGFSDRGVVAPATGVVTKVHKHVGDPVEPGEPLFTLRLLSEATHTAQAELHKTARDIELAREQKSRLTEAGVREVVPGSRIIELENQLRRLEATASGLRQELHTRGLSPRQIELASQGTFATEIEVVAPPTVAQGPGNGPEKRAAATPALEMQELKADLGQQVEAGQALCLLADHHQLYIEGRGFRQEIRLVERAAREGWDVEVEFLEETDAGWPALEQRFQVRQISNSLDRESRTFTFYIPLANSAREYVQNGRTFRAWRFRPGQRLRLRLRVEKIDNVFVVPAEAVVREGPEAYVFHEKGDAYYRVPVHVLHEDRRQVVIAPGPDDEGLKPGNRIADRGALQLNRVLKSKGGELPPGYHMHPDGTVHGPH